MKYYFAIILTTLLFSCKEKVESKLDFERLGVPEENRYTNPDYEFVKKEYPDSVLLEPGDVEFIVEIDTNINEYDSTIFYQEIKATGKLINHSDKLFCFINENSSFLGGLYRTNSEKKIKISYCEESEIIICFPQKISLCLTPFETIEFNFCISDFDSIREIKLGYNLSLISNYHDLDSVDPYQYLKLKANEIDLSKNTIKKALNRKTYSHRVYIN